MAFLRTFSKEGTEATEGERGIGEMERRESASLVKPSQLALSRLTKVFLFEMARSSGVDMEREIVIGRWSEERATEVAQVVQMARDGDAKEMSGEVGEPSLGRRVGVSSLREQRSDWERRSARVAPLVSTEVEYQR